MIMERITSRKNPLIQQVRKLQSSRKARYESGLYVSDGTKLLEEAAKWCDGLDTVLVTETVCLPELPEDVKVYVIPEDVMESVSPMRAPQGALFLCRLPEKKTGEVVPGTLILEGIQDPGNLGTILRTADALNTSVILADGCADPYNWKTVRASMGAAFRTQPSFLTSAQVVSACKEKNIPLAVTALSQVSEDIRSASVGEMAVVIGSEGRGVSDLLMDSSDKKLIIPMNKRCESLNAATAATIVMWQMQLKR